MRKERVNKGNIFNVCEFDWEKDINSEGFNFESIEKIKNKANMLEKEALKHERMLIHMKNGALGLETSEQVNSLIISSIKAKLALLEKFQNS
jgi:hypothetical protein